MSVLLKPTGTRIPMPDEIFIQTNIPIPKSKGNGRPRFGKYLAIQLALEEMEVGDSFISPLPSKPTLAIIKSVRVKMDRKFISRTVQENGHMVLRVWRTK